MIQEIALLDRSRIKGLMTVGLLSANATKIKPCFQLLIDLSVHIASLNFQEIDMKELSMGMSGDLKIAIEQGATFTRVGTAVFGKDRTKLRLKRKQGRMK